MVRSWLTLLTLEEWILEQHTQPDDFQEETIPELEIDGDELLDMERDGILDARVKELLVDCYKPMRSEFLAFWTRAEACRR